jgi:phage terminase large subunit-like protein
VTRIGEQRPRLFSLPHDIDNTEAGDEVIEFAKRFGMVLDDWQQWVIRHMCAEDSSGNWAATQSVLLVPRQAGKSAILEVLEMAALFLWNEQHVIYSAHLGKTATDHMRRMRRHIKAVPEYDRMCRVLTGKGDERVERTDTGAILEFITRGKKSSRGGSPNRVIFDEAMFLAEDQIQAMLPALSAQSMNDEGAPQMVYTSSAPIAESQVLHRLRYRGIAGDQPRMFFAEWSCDPEADPSDRDNWYQANPGLGIRISQEWIEDNEFGTLSEHAFKVERLGIPEEPESTRTIIPLEQWDALADPASRIAGRAVFALDVSPDRKWATFGVAGRRDDGVIHVEVAERRPGTSWVVSFAVDLFAANKSPIRVEKGGPAGSLVSQLLEAGVEVEEVSTADHARATGQFIDAALSGGLAHLGGQSLRSAVVAASLRASGDAELWSRRSSKMDITPLVATTLAVGGVPEPAADLSQDPFVVYA